MVHKVFAFKNKKRGFGLIEVIVSIALLLILFIPSVKYISSTRKYRLYLRDMFMIEQLAKVKIDEVANLLRHDAYYFKQISNQCDSASNKEYIIESDFANMGTPDVISKVRFIKINSESFVIFSYAYYQPDPNDVNYRMEATYSMIVTRRNKYEP